MFREEGRGKRGLRVKGLGFREAAYAGAGVKREGSGEKKRTEGQRGNEHLSSGSPEFPGPTSTSGRKATAQNRRIM